MNATATTISALITDRAARSKRMDNNRSAKAPCLACGKATNATAWYVPVVMDDILPVADATEDTEWFPLGSDCARRVPATHRARLTRGA